MHAERAPSSVIKSKPLAKPKTSIRHSLTLSSVSKAFADVISKEEKTARRSSRRSSTINVAAAPNALQLELNGKALDGKRSITPETSRSSTRGGRSSALPRQSISSDESGTLVEATEPAQATIGHAPTRSASLRPVTRSQTAASLLPKYRPKSLIENPKEEASPTKPEAQRPLSIAEDDEDEVKKQVDSQDMNHSPVLEKAARSISPLPHRGALKVNLKAAFNVSPTKPVAKGKTPSPSVVTPPRPTKTAKRTTLTSTNASSNPRPASSARSSASSNSPCIPKPPLSAASAKALPRAGRENNSQLSTPTRTAARDARTGSLSTKRPAQCETPTPPSRRARANRSLVVEDNSEDDVLRLLAPVASPSASTLAMPRIFRNRAQQPQISQHLTPTRPSPARSCSSLFPPAAEHGSVPRESILSWEQLAAETSPTLKGEDLGKMLADIPAPFLDFPASPPPSAPRSPFPTRLDLPESPALNVLNSPGGYGSISQVLLPDITPSPAVCSDIDQKYAEAAPAVDAAIVTLLRLQLASAENIAHERAERLQVVEEELRLIKETRARDAEELGRQVTVLEEQMRVNMEVCKREDDEKAAQVASLEDQLRQAQGLREEAICVAVGKTLEASQASHDKAFDAQRQTWRLESAALDAATAWRSVRVVAESELELVRSNREMLTVLLAGLDQALRAVC